MTDMVGLKGDETMAICKLVRLPLMTCGRGTGSSLRNGLDPRPERLQNAQLSRTVRGVKTGKSHRSNTTFTTDAISGNLRLSDSNSI